MKTRRPERNRKERKAAYIRIKNLMRRYPNCAYNGDFYCDHIYDPAYPWQWIDFRFFHSRLKRYYAVAMVTAYFEAYNALEDAVLDDAYAKFPTEGRWPDGSFHTVNARYQIRSDYVKDELVIRAGIVKVAPSIELEDYGRVAIGLYATVNTPYIDEHYIRKFIADFRERGEPTQPGWSWHGEEIEVDLRQTP